MTHKSWSGNQNKNHVRPARAPKYCGTTRAVTGSADSKVRRQHGCRSVAAMQGEQHRRAEEEKFVRPFKFVAKSEDVLFALCRTLRCLPNNRRRGVTREHDITNHMSGQILVL